MNKHWPLPEQFRVRLIFESDWHVGSGTGRPGNVDRLIVRDADDLPFVPAKTLRGIWRDACERLCRGLDDGQVGAWSRLVDFLFGSQPALGPNDPTGRHANPAEIPLKSAVQIRSAHIPSPLRDSLVRADRRLRQALTFIKPGVKIDRRSGSAQTDFLRFEEVARRGTVLEAECRLVVSDEPTRKLASALLIASAKMVERLGGKRRRGAGLCRLEIDGADMNAAIEWLEQSTTPPNWSSGKESNTSSDTRRVVEQTDSWLCVPLVLRLQGPLAVSYRTTGNVVETLDFLPGSYLLPHVTQALSGLGLDVRSALQSGDICVLPAYPEVDGERSQPVPLALFAPKGGRGLGEPNAVVNRLRQAEPTDGTQIKQLREGFVSSKATELYKTPITVQTHNTIEDQPQRPTETVGGVYSYEAIAPNDDGRPVILCSELRIRKSLADLLAQSDANWWNRLNGQISIGRSRKDDYGLVTITTLKLKEFVSGVTARNDPLLFVWLVSDTLLRNSRLGAEPTAACLGEELSRRLGVQLKLRQSTNGCLDELVRIRRLDTWHVGWGLPRPSLVALQAGSCMVFEAEGPIDPAKLAQLE
ncbi:MAG: RAMP superfamily CRISPR-associated protein, partial [Gemmatales bacterium]|nr:RAMP superfamily CRISPR-associated protein [Gemmatales bacterium]MDW8386764.1 RAMP superfamily CRISPR-associated protein [Gemmatales bacterium]